MQKNSRHRLTTTVFHEKYLNQVKADTSLTYVVYGKEICPETKKVHWQMYIETKKMRLSTLYKSYQQVNFIQSKGDAAANIVYAIKDLTDIYQRGKPMSTRGRKRKRMEPYCPTITLRPWQNQIIKSISQPPDRKVQWYWSSEGNVGKTTFGKYLTCKHNALCINGKAADIRNGILTYIQNTQEYPTLIVCNIPRSYNSDFLSYEGLENCKDLFFYSGKYEGGQVCGPPCHLVVFANNPPNLAKMSLDRWEVHEIK